MLPIRTRTIFRNRWWALAWAAGIVWTAVQFAGGDETPADASRNDTVALTQGLA